MTASIKNHVEWDEFLKTSKAEDFTGDNYYGTNTCLLYTSPSPRDS